MHIGAAHNKTFWIYVLLAIPLLGCNPENSSTTNPNTVSMAPFPQAENNPSSPLQDRQPVSEPEPDSQTARSLLDRMIATYRSANTYFDSGRVELTYQYQGNKHQDIAPMEIHYVAPDQLYMHVYGTTLKCEAGVLQSVIQDPGSKNLDGQSLYRRLPPKKIDTSDIYSDPILLHYASVGIAGPAPQIELLLSREPLQRLADSKSRIRLGANKILAGKTCRRIIIESGSSQCVLWVDHKINLLRRIELPTDELVDPSHPESAEPLHDARLVIELYNAELNVPPRPLPAVSWPTSPRRVKQLTLPPLPLSSPLLGRKLPRFRLPAQDGSFVATEQGSDRPVTVLLWIAQHESSMLAVEQMQRLSEHIPKTLRLRTRFLIVMAESQANPQTQASFNRLRIDLGWTNDLHAIGRDIFAIRDAPTLCVLGPDGTLQWFQSRMGPDAFPVLERLLADLHSGVQVGSDLRSQYDANRQTYQRLLRQRAVP